ncbi:MAG: hypothetical protein HOM58_20045 [Rhodospirillaceae bacterium]|jgi:hypothetical protein|nr:hypothetical protein [Rhodospirillaceae bacterium]MBT5458077.1 hypothetical protein [Rhodospirillaceae bacterium]
MKIVGTTINERRRDSRPKLPPIKVQIDGKVYATSEWTLGGFLIDKYVGSRRAGGIMTMIVLVEVEDQKFEHFVDAQVVRIDRDRLTMAAKFIEMDPDTIETLDGWLTGRLRRKIKKDQEAAQGLARKTAQKKAKRTAKPKAR